MHTVHDRFELRNIDMNLLLVLDALLQTRSVKEAAARLGCSPSATSHALARLRLSLADPLLVRAGRHMIPTPRAKSIRPRLSQLLADLERTLADEAAFDPKRSRQVFRVAGEDYFSTVLLPSLLAGMGLQAPHCVVEVLGHQDEPEVGLELGRYDVHVGPASRVHAQTLKRQRLFSDDMVCVLRNDHPALAAAGLSHRKTTPTSSAEFKLPIRVYAELGHIMVGVGPRGPTDVDRGLHERGYSRTIACRVAHFVAGPAVVKETDLVLTLPRRLAQRFCVAYGLTLCRIPLPRLRFQYSQFWHPAQHADPAHRWFRGQLHQAALRIGR